MRSAFVAHTLATAADRLQAARQRTLALIEGIEDPDLERVHSPLMSPLAWDMAHIAAFEDLWLAHRLGGLPLLREELMDVYDAFETPRAQRGALESLSPGPAREYMAAVRARVLDVLAAVPDVVFTAELVLRHELQHAETIAQTICLARIPSYSLEALRHLAGPQAAETASAVRVSGLELVTVPAGRRLIGAGPEGFAYDNERPRSAVAVPDFEIGRLPVTNGDYREFIEAGGYQRSDWWTPDGWSWRKEAGVERPGAWTDTLQEEWRIDGPAQLDPYAPVVHVNWYEADAFCRAHRLRLPTEVEWETACAGDPASASARRIEPSRDAMNLDLIAGGTRPVAATTAAASGCVGTLGDVWEWTSSWFNGYPGFVAHPYPEYSEVFFGRTYRVLRGASWATSPRVASSTFRNWDYPQRRQIFAGFRVARSKTPPADAWASLPDQTERTMR